MGRGPLALALARCSSLQRGAVPGPRRVSAPSRPNHNASVGPGYLQDTLFNVAGQGAMSSNSSFSTIAQSEVGLAAMTCMVHDAGLTQFTCTSTDRLLLVFERTRMPKLVGHSGNLKVFAFDQDASCLPPPSECTGMLNPCAFESTLAVWALRSDNDKSHELEMTWLEYE